MRSTPSLSWFFNRPGSVLNSSFRFQFLATLTVNIITFSHGVGVGWLSPTLSKILSPQTPLDFTVQIAEASWIGSLIGLGSLVGNLFFGFCLNRVGRKVCIYMLALPHMCMWILIYCARSVEFLYVARFLGGMTGGGSYVVMPIFISEIADASIRGTLGSMLMLSVNFGVLIGFVISTYLEYHVIPYVTILLPLTYLCATICFPETPQHLLRKGKVMAADKSFRFYRNCSPASGNNSNNSNNNPELLKCDQEFNDLQNIIEKNNQSSSLSYRDFITKPALKAIGTAVVILCANQFSGSFAFINYMSHIFAAAGTTMDPNTCTIITGGVQIVGAYAATIFVDRCGRKVLILISTGGMFLGLTAFGIFTYIGQTVDVAAYSWVPLVLMMFIVFITNMGVVALTFVLLVEIFPVKIRSVAVSVSMVILSAMVFLMLKIFPLFMHTFGISMTMWSCATVCLLSFIYFAIFLPETKGKSMERD